MLLVASVGYRPVTLEDTLAPAFKLMRWGLAHNKAEFDRMGRPEAAVEEVRRRTPPSRGRADYTFEYVVRVEDGRDIRRLRDHPLLPAGTERVERFFRQEIGARTSTRRSR